MLLPYQATSAYRQALNRVPARFTSITFLALMGSPIYSAESELLANGYVLPMACGALAAMATVGILLWRNNKKHQAREKARVTAHQARNSDQPQRKSKAAVDQPADRTTEVILRHGAKIARMGGWSIDLATNELTWSLGLPSIFGRSDNEMPTTLAGMSSLFAPDEKDKWNNTINTLAQAGGVNSVELQVLSPDDGHRWVMSRAELLKDITGAATHIAGISIDITERKRMEETLRVKEQLLSRGFEAAGLGVWEWDQASGKVTWSGELEHLFGLAPGSFLGTFDAYLDAIHPEDRERVQSTIARAMADGGAYRVEHRVKLNDRWLAGRGDLLRDKSGKKIGLAGVVMDITQRRQAVEELRTSEERYRAVVTTMSEGVVIHAADGSIIDCNNSAERILGLTRNQLLGRSNTDPRWRTIHEDGSDFSPEQHPSALAQKTGKSHHGVIIGVCLPNGLQRWLSVNADPLFHADSGKPIGAIATISDITDRFNSNRQLRDSEQRWRSLAENVPDYIIMTDRTGSILFINHIAEGFTREEVLGAPVNNFMPPEFATIIRDGIRRVFDEDAIVKADIKALGVHKESRWYSCHLSPVKHHGRTIAAIMRASDITERMEAENERRQHEQERGRILVHLQTIIDHMPVGCLMWNKDGYITAANPAVERIFGYQSKDLIGTHITGLASGITVKILEQSQVLPNDGGCIQVITSKSKSNYNVTCEWHSTPMRDDAGQVTDVISMMMNIGEREQLEEQLRQSQKMEAVGKLAGGIAHDFNNLLTAIMGYGEMLTNRLSTTDPCMSYVQQIKKAAQRAAALTYQLLAFSRKQVLQTQILSISQVVQELESLLGRLIGEHIVMHTKLPADIWEVLADAGQIEQVVMNLVVNARDAMPLGGTLTIEANNFTHDALSPKHFAEAPHGDYVRLSVMDTGEGMTPEVRLRIFEPFFTTKSEGKGTGLGLAVVFGVVRQTGGYIFVTSEKGHGSQFDILLPRAINRPQAKPGSDSTVQIAVRGSETILLVEDDEAVRTFVRDTLEASGYTVLTVADGHEAIEVSEHYPKRINLLLTDVIMPHLGGREVADMVVKKRADIKVLFMSGYTDDMVLAHGVAEGHKSFLEKPFTAPRLLGRIRKVLAE